MYCEKFERTRPGEDNDGIPDVDAVVTVREIAQMIKDANIDFRNLPDEDFDKLLGESSGAGVIFGVTGGVMEAALRTVADVMAGQDLQRIDFTEVRGLDGIKEAVVPIGDTEVRVAVAHGLGNARKLLDMVRSGEKEYEFIEIMACPGGCVNGGDSPLFLLISATSMTREKFGRQPSMRRIATSRFVSRISIQRSRSCTIRIWKRPTHIRHISSCTRSTRNVRNSQTTSKGICRIRKGHRRKGDGPYHYLLSKKFLFCNQTLHVVETGRLPQQKISCL